MQRLCVVGFYYNNQSQESIAEELGIPVNTVKSHLNRAKGKIKDAVEELNVKKGTKLYTVAPFIFLLFTEEAKACEAPKMSEELRKLALDGKGADIGADGGSSSGMFRGMKPGKKKIIVGKNGNMIKEIGIRARKDIEVVLGRSIYLDLFVKVIPKWRDREKFLNEIGYKEFNFEKDV